MADEVTSENTALLPRITTEEGSLQCDHVNLNYNTKSSASPETQPSSEGAPEVIVETFEVVSTNNDSVKSDEKAIILMNASSSMSMCQNDESRSAEQGNPNDSIPQTAICEDLQIVEVKLMDNSVPIEALEESALPSMTTLNEIFEKSLETSSIVETRPKSSADRGEKYEHPTGARARSASPQVRTVEDSMSNNLDGNRESSSTTMNVTVNRPVSPEILVRRPVISPGDDRSPQYQSDQRINAEKSIHDKVKPVADGTTSTTKLSAMPKSSNSRSAKIPKESAQNKHEPSASDGSEATPITPDVPTSVSCEREPSYQQRVRSRPNTTEVHHATQTETPEPPLDSSDCSSRPRQKAKESTTTPSNELQRNSTEEPRHQQVVVKRPPPIPPHPPVSVVQRNYQSNGSKITSAILTAKATVTGVSSTQAFRKQPNSVAPVSHPPVPSKCRRPSQTLLPQLTHVDQLLIKQRLPVAERKC